MTETLQTSTDSQEIVEQTQEEKKSLPTIDDTLTKIFPDVPGKDSEQQKNQANRNMFQEIFTQNDFTSLPTTTTSNEYSQQDIIQYLNK